MTLYVGAVSPQALIVNVSRGQPNLDLSTVTGAQLEVLKPGAIATVVWNATVSNATATSCTITYAYQSGDLNVAGEYIFLPKLTFPSGTVQCRKVTRTVEDPFT